VGQNKTIEAKLRDINEFLKNKYENYKEFNNLSPREAKLMPFFDNVKKSMDAKGIPMPPQESKHILNTPIRNATILEKLCKLRVHNDLIQKSNRFCRYESKTGKYRREAQETIKKQFWLPSKSSIKNQIIHHTIHHQNSSRLASQSQSSEGASGRRRPHTMLEADYPAETFHSINVAEGHDTDRLDSSQAQGSSGNLQPGQLQPVFFSKHSKRKKATRSNLASEAPKRN